MNGPGLDAWRFAMACLLGLGLGFFYSALRPLRQHHPVLSDLLFLPLLFYAWLYLGFALCRGDIRLSYCMGLVVGIFLWNITLGSWLQPVFSAVWGVVFKIWNGFWSVFKKIFKKLYKNFKNVFAIWKKWVTIVETNRRTMRRKNGGAPIGKKE